LASLREKPGFCDWPDCFQIQAVTVDEVMWADGFLQPTPPKQ